ncbi:hypothetical protein RSAG8_10675, partial [Rhizoctonia solani AG-8 WAC10335]
MHLARVTSAKVPRNFGELGLTTRPVTRGQTLLPLVVARPRLKIALSLTRQTLHARPGTHILPPINHRTLPPDWNWDPPPSRPLSWSAHTGRQLTYTESWSSRSREKAHKSTSPFCVDLTPMADISREVGGTPVAGPILGCPLDFGCLEDSVLGDSEPSPPIGIGIRLRVAPSPGQLIPDANRRTPSPLNQIRFCPGDLWSAPIQGPISEQHNLDDLLPRRQFPDLDVDEDLLGPMDEDEDEEGENLPDDFLPHGPADPSEQEEPFILAAENRPDDDDDPGANDEVNRRSGG